MKRFSIVNNGYNIDEVNNFIDIVIKKLEKLSQDNNNYLLQLEQLKKQVANNQVPRENQNIDARVAKALIAAQETTDKMKELAKEEASLIIKEAKATRTRGSHDSCLLAFIFFTFFHYFKIKRFLIVFLFFINYIILF